MARGNLAGGDFGARKRWVAREERPPTFLPAGKARRSALLLQDDLGRIFCDAQLGAVTTGKVGKTAQDRGGFPALREEGRAARRALHRQTFGKAFKCVFGNSNHGWINTYCGYLR